MNPLTIIDQLMEDYLSPKARRTVHSLLLLAALAVTAYLSFEGDWREALIAAGASIYTWANRANTGVTTLAEAKDSFCGEPGYDAPAFQYEDGWDAEQVPPEVSYATDSKTGD